MMYGANKMDLVCNAQSLGAQPLDAIGDVEDC